MCGLGGLSHSQEQLPLQGGSTAKGRGPKNPVALVVKTPPASAGDIRDSGLIPGLGRNPGGGHGNALQYSSLGNAMDRGG